MLNSFVLPNAEGRLQIVSEEEHIRYSLRAILLTEPEKDRLGEWRGSKIRDFLYRPFTHSLQVELGQHLKEVIDRQESRVEIQSLSITPDPMEKSKLQIDFQYTIKASNKSQSFRLKLTSEGDAYGYPQ